MKIDVIKKALECCIEGRCSMCPLNSSAAGTIECKRECMREALDLINRQNAEIEKLTINMNAFGLGMTRLANDLETAKAEAIKEFAEKVKDIVDEPLQIEGRIIDRIIGKIDNLVKEMVCEE